MNENQYVLVVKEGLYWLAKTMPLPKLQGMTEAIKEGIYENVKLMYKDFYEIDDTLEHNGFEYPEDAWSYLVHLQGFPEEKK